MENKIIRIQVNGLFGFLDHDVPLSEEGVTFIHGPNGCGKTSFLKLIGAFYEWDLLTLITTNYLSMNLWYAGGERIHLQKSITYKEYELSLIHI